MSDAREKAVELMARAMCTAYGTSQCAAICLQRFASANQKGKCSDAVLVHGRSAKAAYDAIITAYPQIARAMEPEMVVVLGPAVKNAYNEGFIQGMRESGPGGKSWIESKSNAAMIAAASDPAS